MNKKTIFEEKVLRVTGYGGRHNLSVVEEALLGMPGVKYLDVVFPVAEYCIDVDPKVFSGAEAEKRLKNMGLSVELREKPVE